MSTKTRKIHHYATGKYTRCGRPKSDVATTREMPKVTCQQCITPNRPFTYSNRE